MAKIYTVSDCFPKMTNLQKMLQDALISEAAQDDSEKRIFVFTRYISEDKTPILKIEGMRAQWVKRIVQDFFRTFSGYDIPQVFEWQDGEKYGCKIVFWPFKIEFERKTVVTISK